MFNRPVRRRSGQYIRPQCLRAKARVQMFVDRPRLSAGSASTPSPLVLDLIERLQAEALEGQRRLGYLASSSAQAPAAEFARALARIDEVASRSITPQLEQVAQTAAQWLAEVAQSPYQQALQAIQEASGAARMAEHLQLDEQIADFQALIADLGLEANTRSIAALTTYEAELLPPASSYIPPSYYMSRSNAVMTWDQSVIYGNVTTGDAVEGDVHHHTHHTTIIIINGPNGVQWYQSESTDLES